MQSYSVANFLAQYNAGSAGVEVSKPMQISCWTKSSVHQGSEFLFGDTSGAGKVQRTLTEGHPETLAVLHSVFTCPCTVMVGRS